MALGGETILSLSPEKFFSTRGETIATRPMKGTAPRGETPEQDRALAEALAGDEKNRAENLMIVDLLRNDLSRLSEVGSVHVTRPVLGRDLSDPAPDDLRREGAAAAGADLRGHFRRPVSLRLGHRRAENPRHGDHRGAGDGAARTFIAAPSGAIAPGGDMRFNVAIRTLTLGENGTPDLSGRFGGGRRFAGAGGI